MKYMRHYNTDICVGEHTITASVGDQIVLKMHRRTVPESADWCIGEGATIAQIAQAAVALLNTMEDDQSET